MSFKLVPMVGDTVMAVEEEIDRSLRDAARVETDPLLALWTAISQHRSMNSCSKASTEMREQK
jgi:hypothetical protein